MTLDDKKKWMYYQDPVTERHMIVILDHEWYATNQNQIEEWMQLNLKKGRDSLIGSVLTFHSQAELNWFALRWV